MTRIEVISFDVDGVLLDSLAQHLQVCRDEARRLNVADVHVPSIEEFRQMVADGAIISPMPEFFRTVGFPTDKAETADAHYRAEFARNYPVAKFAGVTEMLKKIAATGAHLGIVTSNKHNIVSSALGTDMLLFDSRCVFTDDGERLTKPQALLASAREFGVDISAVLYVGDQPRDYEAARQAGAQFLGVSYGWGITVDDTRFPVVRSPAEIASYVSARSNAR